MDRLTPRATELFVVRWIREDGRDVKHKHFTRSADAERFHDRLREAGKDVAIYSTATDWRPHRIPEEK